MMIMDNIFISKVKVLGVIKNKFIFVKMIFRKIGFFDMEKRLVVISFVLFFVLMLMC